MSRILDEHDLQRMTIDYLQAQVDGLHYELHQRELRLAEKDRYIAQLEQQIAELKQQAAPPVPAPPAFVKPNLPAFSRKPPGREVGHPAALRSMRVTGRDNARAVFLGIWIYHDDTTARR